jgi:estrogen-related receptor beta like 1
VYPQYEMAHLRSPFKTDDQNLYALFQRITSCDFPPLSDAYSPELREIVSRMVQIDATARPGMEEVCKIAHNNQKKFASRRNVHLVCEEMAYSLQLLDYGERFCAPRGCRPFSRLYFALGAVAVAGSEEAYSQAAQPYAASGQAQFWTFIELAMWLLVLAEGRQEEAFDPRGQHELAVISDVIDRATRLGCAADFPPARLKAGYGDAVCSLLHDLSKCALRGQRFSWRAHDAVQADVDEAERKEGAMLGAAEELEEDRSLDSVTGCAGTDEERDWSTGAETGPDGDGEVEETFTAMTPEQAVHWRKEAARLAASGQLGAPKLALGKGGWRVSAIVLEKAVSKVAPGVEQAIPALETLTEALSAELDELRHAEAQANSACAEQVKRLQVVSQNWSELAAKHEAASVTLADKTTQFAEVQDDLRALRNQYEEASSGAHDSAPLRDIRRALRTVQKETATMGARIDWLREHLPSHRSLLAGGADQVVAGAAGDAAVE